MLSVDESLKMLNIKTAKFLVATSKSQAVQFARKLKFPCVLKLVSKKVSHKTDVGGVRVARSSKDVLDFCAKFLKKGNVMVQEFIEGVEVILGIKNDPVFGHVLLVGLGGIFVEVYKDVAFRVCPISKKDATAMLNELKGNVLLSGFRGRKPVNKSALIESMVKLSKLPIEFPNIQELDVNPIIVNRKRALAVDARLELN